jgi:hypothetical protein
MPGTESDIFVRSLHLHLFRSNNASDYTSTTTYRSQTNKTTRGTCHGSAFEVKQFILANATLGSIPVVNMINNTAIVLPKNII